MIFTVQEACIGEPGKQEIKTPHESPVQAGLMGIPMVDQKILNHMHCGGVLVIAGGVNGDASMLGAQIAARAINRMCRVLYLSTGQDHDRVTERMFSNAANWPYDQLEDGLLSFEETPGLRIPYDACGNPEFTRRALSFSQRHEKCLDFHLCRDLQQSPLEILDQILSTAVVPDCLIIDELQISGLSGSPGNYTKVDVRKLSNVVMRRLAEYAHENGVTVVVLCQQTPDDFTRTRKRVGTRHIADFPDIGNNCDMFIGISQLRSAVADMELQGSHASAQFFNVHDSDGTSLIPVALNSEFQQLTAREEVDETNDPVLAERAARMVLESKFSGFVMFRRDVFKQVCKLGNPDCINVYALCLLVAEKDKEKMYGTMFYGKEKLGKMLGIDRKRVAKAINALVEATLMKDTGKKKGRAKIYLITELRLSQMPDVSGYFILANNLRDPKRSHLLGNPLLFRVWLGCLFTARYYKDADLLERGQLLRNPYELAELLGGDPEVIDGAIQELVDAGRMEEVDIGFDESRVLEITNYNIYQKGAFYSRKFAAKFAKFIITKPVPNDCQTRSKCVPNRCQMRATI